jgi:alpha-beta hydrolase superfamily lysophospholipase
MALLTGLAACAAVVLALAAATPPAATTPANTEAPMPFPGTTSVWNGYARYDFRVDGRAATVVAPKSAADGRPWIWRARFWGHEPQTDLALLARGFHLAYIDVADMYGSPKAVGHFNAFYAQMTGRYGFAPRVAIEAMSRGGLIALNWAVANPEKVACMYLDNPVCDFRSWPGGRGKGPGSPDDWRKLLAAYGFADDAAALAYTGHPLDRLDAPAKTRVPILCVCGAEDEVVPVAENTALLEQRYAALGGPITVILKAGQKHHPHSLPDPTPIVEFVLRHTGQWRDVP